MVNLTQCYVSYDKVKFWADVAQKLKIPVKILMACLDDEYSLVDVWYLI
jgi:hypothetical protein